MRNSDGLSRFKRGEFNAVKPAESDEKSFDGRGSSRRLSDVMLERGLIRREELSALLDNGDSSAQQYIGAALVEQGRISRETLKDCVADQFGIPRVELRDRVLDQDVVDRVPERIIRQYQLVPIQSVDRTLVVAMVDPFNEEALGALRFSTRMQIEPVRGSAAEISHLISNYFASSAETEAIREAGEPPPNDFRRSVESEAMRKPVVRLVDAIISDGIQRGASDINIRPERANFAVYYRVDGVERFCRRVARSLLEPVIARIKIIARMNVAEHRLPQDGNSTVETQGRRVDLRVSMMPTAKGESAVIRVLDQSKGLRSLDDLGFNEADLAALHAIISRPNGIFLTTGPTGSGKSTTLNSMLVEVSKRNPHIITLEDPVEYDLKDVEQIQIRPEIGYSFAEALRHVLRHDPDVIMVGEIRDLETAQIANKAALTGHLVFSTLHTNDAAGAIARLLDIGIEPYLLSSSLRGVLAQRLVKLNCPACVETVEPDPAMLAALGSTDSGGDFCRGKGCPACDGTGYLGRRIVYELLLMTGEISQLVSRGAAPGELRAAAADSGMAPLDRQVLELARTGLISLEEAYSTRLN